ncbi:MAG: 50S ribosomal protein L29 [Gammaproteobacteria bacterium]|nr:50S ribosomal protein L29 [Gammaproteobacteria bacterium]
MKAKELRLKDDKQLKDELIGLMRERFNLRMQRGVGQLAKTDQLGKIKRDIARIKTILNERLKSNAKG